MIGPLVRSAPTVRPVSHATIEPAQALRCCLGLALALGGATHLFVALQHGATSFALLSLAAGAAQLGLSAAVMLSPSRLPARLALGLVLGLIALYAVNVTAGLPPAIAHSHLPGTHYLWGIPLGWPGPIDAEGLWAKTTELAAAIFALTLERRRRLEHRTA